VGTAGTECAGKAGERPDIALASLHQHVPLAASRVRSARLPPALDPQPSSLLRTGRPTPGARLVSVVD